MNVISVSERRPRCAQLTLSRQWIRTLLERRQKQQRRGSYNQDTILYAKSVSACGFSTTKLTYLSYARPVVIL